MTSPEAAWVSPAPPSEPKQDVESYALECSLRSLIFLGCATAPRSRQTSLGSSEAGHQCDRRLAYRLAGTPATNLADPLRPLVGTGVHLVMADLFRRLDGGSGRFLVEQHVGYRDVPGTVDLYDRFTHTVVDFKTTTASNLKHLRHDGPPRQYVVQVHLYAAALKAEGEDVRYVALAVLPTDGHLDDMWVWRKPYDFAIADEAVDRLAQLLNKDPSTVESKPDRLCPWCDHYRPTTPVDLTIGCPGRGSNA